MESIIYFVLGLVMGVVMVGIKVKRLEKENKMLGGIGGYNKKRDEEKEKLKEKILGLMKEKGVVKNNDVEKLLGVSDSSATRYIEELVADGKVEKTESGGVGTEYRLKK